ncbi:TetR/AcrR family transcriptional regulator [Paenibacillus protaetiae]|uniref:TetR/AcrR family transcriptional regulator n=1 Tax=Paenibacillus protaetiae TaxID=2509456 RepID=A0A4P6EZ41_9BACL|nr:TetR/AcrR family transcriptional regulator [Paenibacillus protaetiae]QAY68136.1 TetR/AcrR family transcriptional regulator [Paenibacillus protaetiae]
MQESGAIDRKAQIIEAASRSFEMFGYKATTMEQVAKIAGVGKGTIYTFFATKEELFGAIIDTLKRELRQVAESSIDHDRPFFDNLANVLDGVLQYRDQHALFVKLSQEVREIGTPMAKEGLRTLELGIVDYIEKEVKAAADKSEIAAGNTLMTAYAMLKLFLALSTDWNERYEPLTREQITDYFSQLFRRGLDAAR